MGAGDLNLLKSWNPKLLKNRKKVWEREQEIEQEEEKFIQRQKEIKKEKELNDLINSTRDQTVKQNLKLKNGLEWMYNDKDNLPEEKEDYLLGRRKLDTSVIKVKNNNNNNSTTPGGKNPFLTSTTGSGVSFGAETRKKYNYSNDDPMAKLMAKRPTAKNTRIVKKVSKKATGKPKGNVSNNVQSTSNNIDY